jgi:hypothetical protein
MSDDSQALIASVTIGKDAEEFLASDLGRTILGMAEQEVTAATEKLKNVAPWRRRRIAELQNDIRRAESFKGWLVELIISGRQALDTLEQAE